MAEISEMNARIREETAHLKPAFELLRYGPARLIAQSPALIQSMLKDDYISRGHLIGSKMNGYALTEKGHAAARLLGVGGWSMDYNAAGGGYAKRAYYRVLTPKGMAVASYDDDVALTSLVSLLNEIEKQCRINRHDGVSRALCVIANRAATQPPSPLETAYTQALVALVREQLAGLPLIA